MERDRRADRRRLGAAVSYLGSYSDRMWNQVALNPGQFLGTSPCTIVGVFYPVCTTAANLDPRRVFYSQNPAEAQFLGPVDRHTDLGTQDYAALKLSIRRRAASGGSLSGNYTVSHCVGNVTPTAFPQISAGYLKPDDPDFDRGNCVQNRTHIANVTGDSRHLGSTARLCACSRPTGGCRVSSARGRARG